MFWPGPRAKQPLVFRQPPPPIRNHNGASMTDGMMGTQLNTIPTPSKTEEEDEENNTERRVGRRNCSYVSGQTRPYYSRRCKRKISKPTTSIESLPEDVIFDILVRVPAQDIYDATRLVCRKWYKIIHTRDFIHTHLQQSTCGLVAWDHFKVRDLVNFISSGKGLFDMCKVKNQFTGRVLSSCNGLVLETRNNCRDVYIRNPSTKQNFSLPQFLTSPTPGGYALAYSATSMEYKVVCAFCPYDFKLQCPKLEPQDDCVDILTVGVDKEWASRVNTKHLSPTAKKLLLFHSPFTTDGFVHWALDESYWEYVVTMNIETEIITQFPVPSPLPCHDGMTQVSYLPMGRYLSLLILRSELSWEFWEMNPETGEWTKMPSMIDLESEFTKARNYILKPVGWLRPREVLIFRANKKPSRYSTRLCVAYNVRTRELQEFKLVSAINRFLVHRNSLVWMDG